VHAGEGERHDGTRDPPNQLDRYGALAHKDFAEDRAGNLAARQRGRPVGTDINLGGRLTTLYTVVTDAAGNLVTVFPGLPKRWGAP